MYPVLSVAGLSLPAKPLLVLAGFYVTLSLGARIARRAGIDGDHVWNWGFISALGGLIVARLAYVARFPQPYLQSPLSVLSPRPGTWMPAAGLVGGIIVGYLYLRSRRVPLGAFVDAVAPALAFGWAVYAFANFMAGDAYGTPSNLPWAVEMWGQKRHPVQLYEMGAALLAVLWLFGRPREVGRGAWGWRLLLAYSLSRLFLESFRGDSTLVLDGYRLAQVGALVGALVALWGLSRLAPPAVRGEEELSEADHFQQQ